jgi:hypothetical protein
MNWKMLKQETLEQSITHAMSFFERHEGVIIKRCKLHPSLITESLGKKFPSIEFVGDESMMEDQLLFEKELKRNKKKVT